MHLRKLKIEDAPYMLEWMHNEDVVRHLSANFASKTIGDCEQFIVGSATDKDNVHLAIADDDDVYMGTVSLKHISPQDGWAEFAITIRSCAMGLGFSRYAMAEIIRYGHHELSLGSIYWCVSAKNQRAVRFYDKNGYKRTEDVPQELLSLYPDDVYDDLIWYVA